MLSREEFIRTSLEINLFYQRLMKEHLFFIQTHLPCIEAAYISEANILKKSFEELLSETVILSNERISMDAIQSHEIVTKYTLPSEEITSTLTGASINTNLTKAELDLISGSDFDCTQRLENTINSLNNRSKNLLENVIIFKKKIYSLQSECKLAIDLYPEIIIHITKEAELYMEILNCLIYKELPPRTVCEELNFWNHVMEDHAEFIDGLLDPTEEELKEASKGFAEIFEKLLEECSIIPNMQLIKKSLDATTDIRNFKQVATIGLLDCKIKSIIPPLLADHVLREANHYIRILNNKS